ncbi:MAG: hypothetical protein AAGH78_10775, partial [Cyanobacteria bacterium P01_H01_bin.58]
NLQQGRVIIKSTLALAPESGINSDMLPAIDINWLEQAFAPGDIPCLLEPVDASPSFQVTVQLIIERGSITNVEPWPDSRDRVYDSLVVCLINNSQPVLVPASPEGVEPPNTYKALLIVDGKFEP